VSRRRLARESARPDDVDPVGRRQLAEGDTDHPPQGIFVAANGTLGAMEWSIDRLIDETQRLAARGLARAEFFAELAPRLRNVIDHDASCWHTLDPHTLMLTSDAPDELIDRGIYAPRQAAAAGELIVRNPRLVSTDILPAAFRGDDAQTAALIKEPHYAHAPSRRDELPIDPA
jgi:hypothetical protein